MEKKSARAPLALGQRIRRRRQSLSMTLQDLSTACGVSVSYLSQVERDNAVPTLGTLAEIAAALQLGIDHFVASPRQADSVTRAGERRQFSIAGNSIVYERISAEFPGCELTSFVMNVPKDFRSEIVQHAGEELIFVLEGEILQVVSGQKFLLRAGDSMHFLGQHPHSWSNPGDGVARLLWTGKMLHPTTPSAYLPQRPSGASSSGGGAVDGRQGTAEDPAR